MLRYFFILKIYGNIYVFMTFIIICLLANIGLVWNAICQPSSSPAGGNYLALDGKDDYAVLDFEKFDVLLEKGTKEFTMEAWIYPVSVPDDETSVVLSQQVAIHLVSSLNPSYQDLKKHMKDNLNTNWERDDFLLVMYAYIRLDDFPDGLSATPYWPVTISPNKWHHIAFQAQDEQIIWICDNLSRIIPQRLTMEDDLSKLGFDEKKNFVLGGYGHLLVSQQPAYRLGSFNGCIDEVRISDIPRYDIKGELVPKWRFERDAHTIALWHFDESHESKIFHDSSGHGYNLTAMNDAGIGPFAVNRYNILATTWASIKLDK